MTPYLLLALNCVLLIGAVPYLKRIRKNGPHWSSLINHFGALGLGWLAFSIFTGLLLSFDLFEEKGDAFLVQGFTEGLQVAMGLFFFGMIATCGPFMIYLRAASKAD